MNRRLAPLPADLTSGQREALTLAEELAAELAPGAEARDREGRLASEHLDAIHRSGVPRLTLPVRYGGLGADPLALCLAQETLAAGCAGTSLALAMHLGIQAILGHTLEGERCDGVLGDVARDRRLFAGGGTEAGTGGDWSGLPVAARRDGSGWRLDARKRFCSGAQWADEYLVLLGSEGAESEPRVTAFLLPRSTPGLRIEPTWDAMGMRASGSDDLVLTDCFATDDAVVGRPGLGFLQVSRFFFWFLFAEASTYLGVAVAAAEATLAEAKRRGPSADDRRAAGRMGAALYPARALLHQEARAFGDPEATRLGYGPDTLARAAMAKRAATRAAVEVTELALERAGGFGYLKGRAVERHYRDARAGPFHPPRNEPTAVELAGRWLLGPAVGGTGPGPATR